MIPSPLRNDLVDAVLVARHDGSGSGPVASLTYAARIVDEVVGSLPEWILEVLNARPTDEGPGVYALACLLRDDESTPPALRAIAAAFTRTRISDRPRARSGDPSTSTVAAENVPVQRRPGGSFHRILTAYAHVRDRDAAMVPADGPGYTAREVEETWSIREAHKRTSDLLSDGLLEVVLDDDGRDVVRDGGRVLAITRAGREELERMDRATSRA